MSNKERLAAIMASKGRAATTSSPTQRQAAARPRKDGGSQPARGAYREGSFSVSDEAVLLKAGDCRDVLRQWPECCVDAIVTDPGMGSGEWPGGVPGREFWAEFLRVAKPGTHMAVFSGRKTLHRAVTYAEDAGWEPKDTIMWVYPKGMPTAIDVGQAVDRKMGGPGTPWFRSVGSMTDEQRIAFTEMAEGNPWWGWGTELRPTWEPISILRKPLDGTYADNAIAWGTGSFNIDATRINSGERDAIATHIPSGQGDAHGSALQKDQEVVGKTTLGRWPADALFSHADGCAASCVPGCAVAALEDVAPGAAKFFYCPKASRAERDLGMGHKENSHKVVKPAALMEWVVKLITPRGGLVLDPFMGTGSTGVSCVRLDGMVRFVGVDVEPAYVELARRRIGAAMAGE